METSTASIVRKGHRPEYRINLFNVLADREDPINVGADTEIGYVPSGVGVLLDDERFSLDLRLPVDATVDDVRELLRWIGEQADGGEVDRWFRFWERKRMEHAGVRVDVIEGEDL